MLSWSNNPYDVPAFLLEPTKKEKVMYVIMPNPQVTSYDINDQMAKAMRFTNGYDSIDQHVTDLMKRGYDDICVFSLIEKYKQPKKVKPIKYLVQDGEVIPA